MPLSCIQKLLTQLRILFLRVYPRHSLKNTLVHFLDIVSKLVLALSGEAGRFLKSLCKDICGLSCS